MSENADEMLNNIHNRRTSKSARDIEKYIAPIQKEIIENIEVGPIDSKVGPNLGALLSERFPSRQDRPRNPLELHDADGSFPDNKITHLACLLFVSQEGAQVEEIVSPTDQSRYIARCTFPNEETRVIELFDTPNTSDKKTPSRLQYKHYLVTNMSTGNTADLVSDIITSGAHVFARVGAGNNMFEQVARETVPPHYNFLDNRINLDPYEIEFQGRRIPTTEILLHETGHSIQFKDKKNVSLPDRFRGAALIIGNVIASEADYLNLPYMSTLKKTTQRHSAVLERNASAFALSIIRKYKHLGVDVVPGFSNEDILTAVNTSLESYQLNTREKGLFSRAKLK